MSEELDKALAELLKSDENALGAALAQYDRKLQRAKIGKTSPYWTFRNRFYNFSNERIRISIVKDDAQAFLVRKGYEF